MTAEEQLYEIKAGVEAIIAKARFQARYIAHLEAVVERCARGEYGCGTLRQTQECEAVLGRRVAA